MVETLTRNWGLVALRGIVAILFGVLTIFYPAITLATLILVDGIFMALAAIANRHGEPRWVALLIGGLLGVAAGLVTLFMPGITAVVLVSLVAAWAILTGIAEIVAAIRLRKEITGEWILVLAGVLAVAFGLLLFVRPGAGALAVVLWIGVYALIYGVVLLALGFRLRSWGRTHAAV